MQKAKQVLTFAKKKVQDTTILCRSAESLRIQPNIVDRSDIGKTQLVVVL